MGKKKGRGRDGGPRTQADGSRCMDSRPTSVQLLSTWTGDSAPSLLVVADAERLVFNAPEGWQRLCVEHGVKVARAVVIESDGDGGGDGAAVDGENAVDDDGAAPPAAKRAKSAPGRRVRAPRRRARRATKHAAAGAALGVRQGRSSALKRGETVTLADGRAVEPSQVVADAATLLRRLEPACYAEPGGAGGAGLRVEGRVVDGRPLLKYVLVPRDGRGLDDSEVPAPEAADAGDWDAAVARGVLEAAANIAAARAATPPDALRDARDAELVFLGTGSAIPSKHRNVSGIYLRCRNAPGAATPAPLPAPREPGAGLLLDCGEGTLGQLHKVYGGATDAVLAGLGAIWVSHPHADHHLGLPALLAARRRLGSPPVALMAPWPVLRFLADYGRAFGDLRGTYEPVECQWMGERAPNPAAATLRETLGLEACFCVPVVHCAQSYGLVVRSADGWSLAYSGDCRPSRELAAAARGATVLVHEATFEDEFWEDAGATRRCRGRRRQRDAARRARCSR
ncbi:3'-tRNA processing endoribonuclease [Aureococcus anophagefferens]|nr:3'-tRNA processing endoribonuclease [Aureococcus anophagefferens]